MFTLGTLNTINIRFNHLKHAQMIKLLSKHWDQRKMEVLQLKKRYGGCEGVLELMLHLRLFKNLKEVKIEF